MNVPGVPIPIPSLTNKDRVDLELALNLGVDFVALSFVRSASDVREMRTLLSGADPEVHVIAKIEKAEAVAALPEIAAEADGLMVARGDLGVEIGPASVPLLQKRIILAALDRGKPVITATQMLESMEHRPEPTRAEASDVANAILDGTSALMLSGETAIGEFPLEAVEYMDRIARAVEPSLGYRHQIPEASDEPTVGNAMSNAACDLAEAVGAKAILVPTFTGRTASAVARLRPRRPIIGITHHPHAVQQMALEWGVTPVLVDEASDVEDLWTRALEAARGSGIVDEGDRVVITAGTAVNIPGSTNVIKVDLAVAGPPPRPANGAGRMATAERARKKKPPRSTIALRWAGVAALALVAFLYYRPLNSYLSTRSALDQRSAEVSHLRAEHDALTRRLTRSTSKEALERAARHLGLVRPGERLYIVKGINAWLRAHPSTLGSDG